MAGANQGIVIYPTATIFTLEDSDAADDIP